jgi:trans-aconitate methyltransferase
MFDSAQRALGAEASLRVLSFGCSTGEECVALSSRFPYSTIVGADISRSALATARKRSSRPNIVYLHARPEGLHKHAPFDLIFALSVLCRWPELQSVDDSSEIYSFEVFERGVALLDSLLRPGGVLVVHNASYHFMEAQVARGYEQVEGWDLEQEIVDKFSRHNRRSSESSVAAQVFRKVSR